MSDCMTFPDTVEEFMEQYKIVDTEQVYTNGTELVPIFRMKQWFKHLPSAQPEYYDYSDIDDVWEYYAKEQDIKLTDNAKQLKDAMWVGYQKGKQDAQPERKKGRWIMCTESIEETFHTGSRCSACNYWKPMGTWNYCPNCGAYMGGDT